MLAKVHSCAIVGLEGAIVEVEVDTSRGLPSFTIVGLPDTAVQESRERVQAAVKKYFRSARGIQEFAEQPVAPDLYRLKVFLVINTTTPAEIQTAVDNAIANNDWLILVFHKIVTTPTVSTEYSTANFTTVMSNLNASGAIVKTVSEVLNRVEEPTIEAVYAYVDTPAATTITTADTWYFFNSTFEYEFPFEF